MSVFAFHHVIALCVGALLDLLFGDPYWLPHPIRWIGNLIAALEKPLRKAAGDSVASQRAAGVVLVVLIAGISTGCAILLIWACWQLSPWLALVVECIICYQMLAGKQLKIESMRVHDALVNGTIEEARASVAMIVGRDTDSLDAQGVTKAAVETVAENASDGVVAPMLFMGLFGPAGGVFYKSVNTMDSMVGYKNDVYRYFGTAAALFDDVLNFIPARLAGLLMCLGAFLCHMDGKAAWRIFKRDRRKHASPNSAHTESACAGALGIELAGGATYFGVFHDKETIGDATREIAPDDIRKANRLMYATGVLSLIVAAGLGLLVVGGVMLAWRQ